MAIAGIVNEIVTSAPLRGGPRCVIASVIVFQAVARFDRIRTAKLSPPPQNAAFAGPGPMAAVATFAVRGKVTAALLSDV